MPIVRINMFEGRSLDQKRRMADEVSKIVADICDVQQEGVHVLFEEMSRDSWARGGTLHRDRGPKYETTSAYARTSFRSISRVTVTPEGVEPYLAYRREHVNPAMATMPGFRSTMTLRDLDDRESFLIINDWDDEAAWRNYQSTQQHDRLKEKIRGELVTHMEIGRYATVDLPFSDRLDDPSAPHTFFTVSTHVLRTDVDDLYLTLRKTAVHPAMAEFKGFVSSNALQSLDAHYQYLIVNSWESAEAANGYSHDAAHYALRDQVRAILSEHSGTRRYELVAS
jgi:4-oxalocrotonate tautomerase